MRLRMEEGTFTMTSEFITPDLDWAKMASFIRLILQSQRRWKDTAGFCLYKGTKKHFKEPINSNHPLPT